MRVRSLLIAAALALAAPLAGPVAGYAADMPSSYVPPPAPPPAAYVPSGACLTLEPSDVYVPPQTAYIVACTVELRQTWRRYANPLWYEGKLVYFNGWSAGRPAVNLLVVPR